MVDGKEPKAKNDVLFKDMSFCEKIHYVYSKITLEPMVACFVYPSMLLMLGVQNLNLEKAYRVNLNYNQTVCDALRARETSSYGAEEAAIQRLVATMTGWKLAISSAMSCMLILFFGSWSDRHGKRKPCMLIPLCGQILMAFSLLLCVYFDRTPIELAIFVEAFFPSITGSHITMMVGIFSYMADITKESERTVRLGIISLVYSVGIPFGMAFSGILLRKVGFYGVFSLAGTLYVTALLYGLFIVKEVPPKPENSQAVKKSFCADFFDTAHIRETFMVAFKARVKNRRLKIIALMAVVIIVVGPQHVSLIMFQSFRASNKIVSRNELGKVNSLFGIVESSAPLLYSPALAAIYSATLTKMPGAFFLVGGILTIPGVLIFIWISMINRAEAKELAKSPVTVQKDYSLK